MDKTCKLNVEEENNEVPEKLPEKIISMRNCYGRKEYYIKWKGRGIGENSWEGEDNINCPDLLMQFEDNIKKKEVAKKNSKKRKASQGTARSKNERPSTSDNVHDFEKTSASSSKGNEDTINPKSTPEACIKDNELRGFDRGLEPEIIIGATDSTGVLTFLMKWQDVDEPELVSSKEANKLCPQIVIKFYEEHLFFLNKCKYKGKDEDEGTGNKKRKGKGKRNRKTSKHS